MIPMENSADHYFHRFDPYRVPSPCYVIDEIKLIENLKILDQLRSQSGARVLLALKAFSMFEVADLIVQYLDGVCASGLWEARLGREEFNGEVHTFATAFAKEDMDAVLAYSDHIVFNSISQWNQFSDQVVAYQKNNPIKVGLRINPEHSEGENSLYDPCAPCSRLGTPAAQMSNVDLTGISGFHFHTLCEQLLPPLTRTLDAVIDRFGGHLKNLEWVNFGGGHLITHPQYDVAGLVNLVQQFQEKYSVQVYLEPGEAVVLNAGILVTQVLDTSINQVPQAILDCSATCHMPDIIEAPYRASIIGAGEETQYTFDYQLGGPTCLAGDSFGRYSFQQTLNIGDRLIFEDQAPYTMVKNTTFNGIKLPAIALWNSQTDKLKLVKEFDYSTFRERLS